MLDEHKRQAAAICERKDDSNDWMERNFYDEWLAADRNYRCERKPERDLEGNEDLSLTSLGMPDTFGYVRRAVARGTAQVPDLRFKSRENYGQDNGRYLMYLWDKGGNQRWQKLHFQQACLFGWSVRAWYWDWQQAKRRKRVDPYKQENWPAVAEHYGIDLMSMPPEDAAMAISELLLQKGRGMYVPIEYDATIYDGPRSEVLLVADCYPQPNFRTIQTSDYFIIQRRRNKRWIKGVQDMYRETNPEIAQALHELMEKYPEGTRAPWLTDESNRGKNFRRYLDEAGDTDRFNTDDMFSKTFEWTFIEEHRPGSNPTISFVAERDHFIGTVPYPYDLEGKIAFTEAVLIDDMSSGIGDSVPRILRGLQELRNRLSCRKADLVYNIVRPMMWTSDRKLYQDAHKVLKRGSGFRVGLMAGGAGSLWMQNESPAQAAAIAALNEEGAMMRAFQTGSGESNMSMQANVDPQQNRTATGARLSAAIGDILTKDILDSFVNSSVNADAEMMYLLVRSEMRTPEDVDLGPYRRDYLAVPTQALEGPSQQNKPEWVRVSPEDFQNDGEVVVTAGSTLAEDDQDRLNQAIAMYQMFSGNPAVNQVRLISEVLTRFGKGRELSDWIVPPPPPQAPPPPLRGNISISARLEEVAAANPAIAMAMLEAGGIIPPQGQPQGGPPPGGTIGPPQGMPPGASGPPSQLSPEMVQALLTQPQGNPEMETFQAATGMGEY